MSLPNILLTAICGLMPIGLGLSADEPQDAAPQFSQNTAVLLFRSGRAVEGQISETEGTYVVRRPIGKVEVPKSEVEFVGADFEAVYRHKLETINGQDAEALVGLARWCLQVGLNEHAIEMVDRAAKLAPQSSQREAVLEALRRTARASEKTAAAPPMTKISSQEEPISRPQASLQQGVSAALLSNFSVQVQPMLTRACATAGCHDASHAGPLTLQRSSRPVAKVTQQNLRAVLSQLNPDAPDNSPILTYSVRPHGRLTASPLSKGVSEPAFVTLADWVRSVCGKPTTKLKTDTDGAGTVARSDPPPNTTPQPPAVPESPAPSRSNSVGVPPRPEPNKAPVARTQSDRGPVAAQQAAPATAPAPAGPYQPADPFDPEIFNRQFAPRPK